MLLAIAVEFPHEQCNLVTDDDDNDVATVHRESNTWIWFHIFAGLFAVVVDWKITTLDR